MANRQIWRHAKVATLADTHGWGWLDRAALVVEHGKFVWIGPDAKLPAKFARDTSAEQHLHGALVTPALIDCHTHLVYGGHRADEFAQRHGGVSYEEIAKAGGGIRSTVRATRAASDADLVRLATERARTLAAEGVATLEIKSGYGLSQHDEARCLRAARHVERDTGMTVRATYLAAHAVPPEFDGRPDDYIDAVCAWMSALHAEGLIDAVDAFCERIAFTTAQTRRVFDTAKTLKLPVKLHAEQLSNQQGAELAAEFAALSCDHLEYLSPEGIAAMSKAGSVAVLLPGAFYFLRETQFPPVAALRAAGVPIAIATDHNPGSSPVLSLHAIIHMACTLFRLTPDEAFRGVTVNAAKALGLADRGVIAESLRADFVVWDMDHPNELAYWLGRNRARSLFVAGEAPSP